MVDITALVMGYLLGSVSPAYFPGRLLEGIDIRKHGGYFAGTTNVITFWDRLPLRLPNSCR